jgi:outer membrane protein assembly factor BamB
MIRRASFVVVLLAVLSTSTTGLAASSGKPASIKAAGLPAAITSNGSWTTYHHDNAHTGYDPLAPAVGTVSPTPGWALTALDAEVYAEPLIYNGLVYTATLNNTVYALNQSTGAVVWQNHLGAPVLSGWRCGNVAPQGILGTPVIDVTGGRIYVTTLFASDHLYRVFGLDLATGTIMLTTALSPLGTGFDWTIQQQRGALAVANGYVYVPFGGRAGDCFDGSTPYYGWVVGVPTSGTGSFNVFQTPSSAESVWAAGGVVVDDTSHNVFVSTGNAIPCPGSSLSDAVVRLSPTLAMQDFFEPNDWEANWCTLDLDLGSASPVLISPNLMFASGKYGGGFLLDPTNLGGVNGQLYPPNSPYQQAEVCFGSHAGVTYGSFAYAAPFVYVECDLRGLVALNVNTSTPSFSVCDAACAAPNWTAAGTTTFGPPIVAGGAVWVASDGGGLYAFNASNGAQIYHSAGFGINRFVTPAEAGGQVFVPSHTVIRSFTFAAAPPPPPTVVLLAPNNGPTAGATSVTITGTNLTGATAVMFGTAAAATFAVTSATQITATSPPGSGIVDVTVTSPAGTSATSAADKFAYTLPPAAYTALTPVRLMDTRTSGGPLGPASVRNLTVVGAGPLAPAGATGVMLNVTAANTSAAGYLTAYPTGSVVPLASNLNWTAAKTVPNLVSVQVGSGGQVSFYNSAGSTDVVVDLEGYFAPPSGTAGGEVALTPARITDTRSGSALGAGASLDIQVTGAGGVPATGVSAAVLNVTVTNTTAASFLTVWPQGAARPTASNLNWGAGQTVPNRVIVPVSATGKVSVYNQFGTTDVIVDVSGYFTDATATGKLFVSQSPFRIADTRGTATLGAASTYTLQVGGVAGVPTTATAVILNVTATNTTAPSFLTVYPSTAARPTASDLNWVGGLTIPNMVVAALGTTGAITFYNSAGSTDVVVDLLGYFN